MALFGIAQKEILINLKYQVEGEEKAIASAARLKQLGYGVNKQGKFFDTATGTYAPKEKVLEAERNMRSAERASKEKEKAEKAQVTSQQRATKSLYGLLGSMFLLAALSTSIFTMLNPAMEMVGVFDLLALILALLFLPIALKMIPVLLSLLKVVESIPNEIKLGIGAFLLFVAILAVVLGLIASIVLAAAGLAGISAGVATVMAAVAAIGLLIAAIGALFLVVDDWLDKNKTGILSAMGAKTPEEQAQLSASFTAASNAIPDANSATGSWLMSHPAGWGVIAADWIMGKLGGGSTTNNSSSTDIFNFFRTQDNNQPILDSPSTSGQTR